MGYFNTDDMVQGELQSAPFGVLKNYNFVCCGTGIEWPDLDYQLSIESMLVAVPAQQTA